MCTAAVCPLELTMPSISCLGIYQTAAPGAPAAPAALLDHKLSHLRRLLLARVREAGDVAQAAAVAHAQLRLPVAVLVLAGRGKGVGTSLHFTLRLNPLSFFCGTGGSGTLGTGVGQRWVGGNNCVAAVMRPKARASFPYEACYG